MGHSNIWNAHPKLWSWITCLPSLWKLSWDHQEVRADVLQTVLPQQRKRNRVHQGPVNFPVLISYVRKFPKEAIDNAKQWIHRYGIADGVTNISVPLSQAMKMMSKTGDLLSLIFLITDGSVEGEREICIAMKRQLAKEGLSSPRICTFGIGSYCNHYFLQMLAQIGRGYYDAAFDVYSINFRLERLFDRASSVILADISIDSRENLHSLELYPFHLPDLSPGSLLVVSERCVGNLPDSIKFRGALADSSNLIINAKVQKAKDIPMERIFAKSQIDAITAMAWLSESKQLEEKVAKMSFQTGVPSEYTHVILVESSRRKEKQTSKPDPAD